MPQETRTCQNCKQNFTIEPEDFAFYETIKVPPPTFCPWCRMKRMMVWRNERALYARQDAFNKHVISVFAPDSRYTVYNRDYWWSDQWDARDYGLKLDFTKPFFEQFKELLQTVPLVSIFNTNTVNSPYTNHVTDLKDCYLTFACAFCENVAYSDRSGKSRDCYDISVSDDCELCYEIIDCDESYKLCYSQKCSKCVNSMFLYDCKNCQDCFGCVGLRNKQYCIFNEQYTKEEYSEKLRAFDPGSWTSVQDLSKQFNEFSLRFPRKFARLTNAVNVSGDNLSNVKNCYFCFDKRKEVEDGKYLIHGGFGEKSSYDCYGTGVSEWQYEAIDSGMGASMSRFAIVGYGMLDTYYVYNCHNSSNLFGCIGLRNKQYCILNKQYTKEEYLELLPRVISHMNEMPYTDNRGIVYKFGEFFPSELSPFAYNETIAAEHAPLTKEQALEEGFRWKEKEEKQHHPTLTVNQLPDHIQDVNETITQEIIACSHDSSCNHQCSGAFRILPAELAFYKTMSIPLPRFCHNCRYFGRLIRRNPPRLWHRHCMKEGCQNEFQTSYEPDRPEIVYCETCYQQEVV